jgi:hypothetical protein
MRRSHGKVARKWTVIQTGRFFPQKISKSKMQKVCFK